MQTTIDKQKNSLLKRYHTLLGKLNINNDEKLVILSGYGVESGRDLSINDLLDLCHRLDLMLNPQLAEADKWRRRVIAAIGGWLRKLGKDGGNIELIKAIAVRAAMGEIETHRGVTFNAIPSERLRSIYYAFSNKSRDLQFVEDVTAEEIAVLTSSN